MIKYIALLRGINISGKNKVSMPILKETFNDLGYKNVTTYLNSGNVIFSSDISNEKLIIETIHNSIKKVFNISIPIYLISYANLKDLVKNRPNWWGKNNKEIYDNIIFVISPYTYEEVYDFIGPPKENIEKIQRYKNNIFWSYNLKDYRKTNWWSSLAKDGVNNKVTVRTSGTINKILNICEEKNSI